MNTLLANLMAPTGGSASSSLVMLLIQFGAIILIFYFLLIRPQSVARKKHANLLGGLKKGDDITTAGGIVGKVTKVEDNFVEVEIAPNTRVRVVKSTLSDITSPNTKPAND